MHRIRSTEFVTLHARNWTYPCTSLIYSNIIQLHWEIWSLHGRALSPTVTTSIFDLLLKRIDLDLKLPVKGFLNDPSCLSTQLVNSFLRSSKGFK